MKRAFLYYLCFDVTQGWINLMTTTFVQHFGRKGGNWQHWAKVVAHWFATSCAFHSRSNLWLLKIEQNPKDRLCQSHRVGDRGCPKWWCILFLARHDTYIYLNYFYSTKITSDVNDTRDNQVTNQSDLLL